MMASPINVDEIKKATNQGHLVYWKQTNYPIVQDNRGQYLIWCTNNDHFISLTNQDGELNGSISDFYYYDSNPT